MGRMDSAVLSVCCTRSPEKSLVFMWLSAGHRRNVQRAAVIRGAVFCSLAIVAKTVDPRIARARWFHGDRGVDSFSVASAYFDSLHRHRHYYRAYFLIPSATQIAASKRLDRRSNRMRGICDRRFHRRKLRLATSRFYLRQRALFLSFHQFVLQPAIPSLQAGLVIEGALVVTSLWTSAFRSHSAMGPAPALPWRVGALRARRRTTDA